MIVFILVYSYRMMPVGNIMMKRFKPKWWNASMQHLNLSRILSKWRNIRENCSRPLHLTSSHPFEDVLLAINFNHPFYHNIDVLTRYYKPIFRHYVICGPEADTTGKNDIIVVLQPHEYGYYGFQCLVEAIRRNPGYAGYLYVNDDMIINWWNFYNLDKTKVWFPIKGLGRRDMTLPAKTFWWNRAACLERCIKTYSEIEKDPKFIEIKAIDRYMNNVGHKRVCVNGLSDIVYIPGRLAKNFEMIGQRFYDRRLFLEVSTPMAVLMLENKDDVIHLDGLYLQLKYLQWGPWTGDTRRAWNDYNYNVHFLHPYKFTGQNEGKNTHEFEERVLSISETILQENCLDPLNAGRFWAKS